MFVHDIIKIKLSREGYLPDYPPHLISDAEMCDAFLPYTYDADDPLSGFDACMDTEINYFRDNYPLVAPSLDKEYKQLVADIAYYLNELKTTTLDDYALPNWVYSYMIGSTLSVNSDIHDLHDMFVMLGTDNLYDIFNAECSEACYIESAKWITKIPKNKRVHRPPTMFGEPHVIKSLRIKSLI
jgi:hypothetical protein